MDVEALVLVLIVVLKDTFYVDCRAYWIILPSYLLIKIEGIYIKSPILFIKIK